MDGTLKQTLSPDQQQFSAGCRMLASMCRSERTEAGIFLWGLLKFYDNDLVRKGLVVEALGDLKIERTAEILFDELGRIKSSNTTRGYINMILKTISPLPPELTAEGLRRLMSEDKWSYKMKRKFEAILYGDWAYL